jgi:cytoskeletal protein CcmA (bactofilin family)
VVPQWILATGTREEEAPKVAYNGETTIATDAVFTGLMTGEDLTIEGRFDGDLEVRGTLRIAPTGRVKAKVKASAVDLRGEFDGEVRTTTLVFGETARARGVFVADKLTIREGAVVNGALNLDKRPPAAPAAAAPAAKTEPDAPASTPASA